MILNENKFLNEAFNNIPDWLKQYLAFQNKALNYSSRDKEFNVRQDRVRRGYPNPSRGTLIFNGEPYTIYPGYFSTRKENEFSGKYNKYIGDLRYSHGLLNAFRSKGFDVSNMSIIESDIPEKGSDKRLKEPNIPIFLLYDNYGGWKDQKGVCQVYAKGINDDEICVFSDEKNDKRLGSIPMKFLLEKCIAFAYLDGSDENNKMSDEEIDRRIKRDTETPYKSPNERLPKKFMKNIEDNYWGTDYKNTTYRTYSDNADHDWRLGQEFDKSGYVHRISPVVPNDSKDFSKFLDKDKQRKYEKIKEKSFTNIDDVLDTFHKINSEYRNVLRYSSWLDSADKFNPSKNTTLKRTKNKIEELKKAIEELKAYRDENGYEGTTRDDWGLESLFNKCYSLSKNIKSALDTLKQTSSEDDEYSDYSELDWD